MKKAEIRKALNDLKENLNECNRKPNNDSLSNVTKSYDADGKLIDVSFAVHFIDGMLEDLTKYNDHSDDYYKLAIKFIELAIENDYQISRSPYSDSYYAFEQGEYIDWGHKPVNSYRLANHWNWLSDDRTLNCPTVDNENYGLALCKFNGKAYEKVIKKECHEFNWQY